MIYAIADLHLSLSGKKPMDVFGDNWKNHTEKIKKAWCEQVCDTDLVILPGDLSWGMKLEEADIDLKWIISLPGRKLLVKGNHDYWWQSISRLQNMYQDRGLHFLQNDVYYEGDIAICGTRGWVCPGSDLYHEEDEKIYIREVNRLRSSLEFVKDKNMKIIVAMHYPPTNEHHDESDFIKLFKEYGVSKVIYGHLHGEDYYDYSYRGIIDNIEYQLVSADYLNFRPLRIQ